MQPTAFVARSGRTVSTLLVLLSVPLVLANCAPSRHLETVRVLQDFAAGEGASALKQQTPAPQRRAVTFSSDGRQGEGDLYLPGSLEGCGESPAAASTHCPRAAIVAVPGAVPLGKDDPRLVAFATTMARAGFAVLAPELAGFRKLQIRPSDAREIADAFAYLVSRPELAPGGRAGMFAFSYSVGPAVLAALEGDVRDRVRFLVGLGGYHDLLRAMRFFTTGWYFHDSVWHYVQPDDTGRLVLVYSSLDYFASAADRTVFDAMVAARTKDPAADLSPLAGTLGESARRVYDLAVNDNPDRFPALFAQLPAPMRADIERLNLAQRNLRALKARLILVHGRNDNLIPWPESFGLAGAVPAGQAKVYLIHHVIGHVDLRVSSVLSWRFWREDLPDLWRLWRAVDGLLAERGGPG